MFPLRQPLACGTSRLRNQGATLFSSLCCFTFLNPAAQWRSFSSTLRHFVPQTQSSQYKQQSKSKNNNKDSNSNSNSNSQKSSKFFAFYQQLQLQQQQQQQQQNELQLPSKSPSLAKRGGERAAASRRVAGNQQQQKQQRVPTGFWNNINNHKLFFDWVGRQFGIGVATTPAATAAADNGNDNNHHHHHHHDLDVDLDRWYSITVDDVEKLGGRGLLRGYYNGSLQQALAAIYPHHEWLPWKFKHVHRTFWRDLTNQKRFMDWAGRQLGVIKDNNDDNSGGGLEGWYSVVLADLEKLGGRGLLRWYYNSSLQQALAAVYPHYEWLPWKFQHTTKCFWADPANQKLFFDWASKQLGIGMMDDWYVVATEDIETLGGFSLLQRYYGGSLPKALAAVYPEHDWQAWRFRSYRGDTSKLAANNELKSYVEHLAAGLGVTQLNDWYRVSQQLILDVGGNRAVRTVKEHGGLYAMLRRLYPSHAWQAGLFEHNKGKKTTQRWLFVVVQHLFPNTEIIEEYTHPVAKFTRSGKNVTLDVFVPSLSLAFEYQGEQHYRDIRGFFDDVKARQEREVEKSSLCAQHGITLVPVPYWWNRTVEDLAATIRELRPELFELPHPSATSAGVMQAAGEVTMRSQIAARGRPIPQQKPSQPPPQYSFPNLTND